jgi:hypothetical protein
MDFETFSDQGNTSPSWPGDKEPVFDTLPWPHAPSEKAIFAVAAAGEPVTAPGLPLPPEKRAAYITEDCIRPPKI